MDADIRSTLHDVTCNTVPDSTNPGFTAAFECMMTSDPASGRPACHFTWRLAPVFAAATVLATAVNREDVVTKFGTSGYGKSGLSGGPPSKAPYMGVAFVACASGSLPNPVPEGNLRVAFVLADAGELLKYHFVFRTVGFDWVAPEHFARPYLAELFALTSLYHVSRIIFADTQHFTQTVTSSEHHDLFGVKELTALRQTPWKNVRVGNQSDGQLGNSRGSCFLVADVSGLIGSAGNVHVAAAAVTSDLSTADRSLVLIPTKGEPMSLPCTLVSALITRNMTAANNYPAGLTGNSLRYYPAQGESTRDAMRRGYGVRAAGLTLYLLGFGVSYDAKRRPTHVAGLWPRDEFIPVHDSTTSTP